MSKVSKASRAAFLFSSLSEERTNMAAMQGTQTRSREILVFFLFFVFLFFWGGQYLQNNQMKQASENACTCSTF